MTSINFIYSIVFGLSIFGGTPSDAACRVCSPTSYAACLNETAFSICYDGQTLSETIEICSNDQVCTSQVGVCKPKDLAAPECGVCSICASGFACLSKTQFEYCNGATLTGIVGKCPTDHYCSIPNLIQNQNICIKSCSSEPSCYKEDVLPPTTPAPDYNSICSDIPSQGNYENIYDSTCKSFVYCESINGFTHSVLLYCADGTYFDHSTSKCVATKPIGCT